MNYIQLINGFWQCDFEHHFTPSDTRLYFYLLHTCNSLGWKNPFGHSDRHLSLKLGIAVNTIREAKTRLKQKGLIDYTTPDKKSRSYEGQTKYIIKEITVSMVNTVYASTVSEIDTDTDTDTGAVPDTVPDTNNKLNKTKQRIEKVIENPSPEFIEQWERWELFRKEKKKTLTDSTIQSQLKFLAKYDQSICLEIIEQSIRNGWTGLFEVKQTASVVQLRQLGATGTSSWTPTEKDQW